MNITAQNYPQQITPAILAKMPADAREMSENLQVNWNVLASDPEFRDVVAYVVSEANKAAQPPRRRVNYTPAGGPVKGYRPFRSTVREVKPEKPAPTKPASAKKKEVNKFGQYVRFQVQGQPRAGVVVSQNYTEGGPIKMVVKDDLGVEFYLGKTQIERITKGQYNALVKKLNAKPAGAPKKAAKRPGLTKAKTAANQTRKANAARKSKSSSKTNSKMGIVKKLGKALGLTKKTSPKKTTAKPKAAAARKTVTPGRKPGRRTVRSAKVKANNEKFGQIQNVVLNDFYQAGKRNAPKPAVKAAYKKAARTLGLGK